jgi:transcriptional regulator with XRE-family HTH domain
MGIRERFAAALLTERRRRHLSQHDLAERAKVSTSYVSMLERGLRSPPLDTIEALAKALGVHPARMVGGKA